MYVWTLAGFIAPTINFMTIWFIPIVKYTVKVYTPDAHARIDYRLTVRIKGQGELKTADHVMHETTQVTEKYDICVFVCVPPCCEGFFLAVMGMLDMHIPSYLL